MRPTVVRLVLCGALFVVWLGYLGYLVATRPRTPEGTPLVLSRPQIQTSQVTVVAQVDDPTGEVEVVEVLHGAGLAEGSKIRVSNLDRCSPVARSQGAPVGVYVVTPEGLGKVAAIRKDDKEAVIRKDDKESVVDVRLLDGRLISLAPRVVSRADWSGPGRYLLPLRHLPGQAGTYEVTAIPPSPGFGEPGVVRIYPATAEARAQYRRIKPPE